MHSAQGMSADRVEAVSHGMQGVSISAETGSGIVGISTEAERDRYVEEAIAPSEDQGVEEEVDENDPLWKVSILPFFLLEVIGVSLFALRCTDINRCFLCLRVFKSCCASITE